MRTLEQIRNEDAERYATDGSPVRLVALDIPFSTILKVSIQVALVQCLFGVIVAVVLKALDVI
jgi:hypothetical protein